MKALTIIQPWASLIVRGHKGVENRTWSTSYRGRLLIHAGKKSLDPLGVSLADQLKISLPDDLPTGAIIGECELVDCVPVRSLTIRDLFEEKDKPIDPFAFGPICWVLKNAKSYAEPIPCRGAQGLWIPPAELLS